MALLYEEKPGEIRVYPHRCPAVNGAEPLLVWSWIQYFLAVICLAVLCFMVRHGLYRDHLLKFLSELGLLAFLVWRIAVKSTCVVFSARQKRTWSSFLFFSWNSVPFRDIADIRLQDQERFGTIRFQFAAARKNPYQPPVKISFPVPHMEQLSLFVHEVIPLLQEMIPGEGRTAEVAVEALEVPVEEAPVLLAEAAKAAGGTKRQRRLVWFREKDRVFTISMKSILVKLAAAGAAFTLLVSVLNSLQRVSTAGYVPWILYAVIITLFLAFFPDVNIDLSADCSRKVFIYHTKFGFKRNEVPFGQLITFTLKEDYGILRICMVFKGIPINPNLCITRSPEKAKAVHEEICSILGLPPGAWLDG